MNTLILAAALPTTGTLISLLVWVAIAAVVVWAILALIRWSGIAIPKPVIVIFWAFVAIGMIVFMARMFGVLV